MAEIKAEIALMAEIGEEPIVYNALFVVVWVMLLKFVHLLNLEWVLHLRLTIECVSFAICRDILLEIAQSLKMKILSQCMIEQ